MMVCDWPSLLRRIPSSSAGLSDGILNVPHGVAGTSDGTKQIIYVADWGNNRVVRLEAEYEQPRCAPSGLWECFKAALWADDLDRALSFFADRVHDNYAVILGELRPQFQTMVSGMRGLELISVKPDAVNCEMLYDEGGGVIAAFPVHFMKDELGNWKICCF